jgi:hypothetical protein
MLLIVLKQTNDSLFINNNQQEVLMKRFACVLPILLASFIVGCDDGGNVMNAPANGVASEKQFAKPAACRRILLNRILRVPGEFNSFIEVNGFVEYVMTIVPRDPIPPNPQFSILIEMLLNAELRPYEFTEPVWHVAASTNDDVVPTGDGGATGYLTKRYFVSGLNRWLCLSFTLTETSVELSRSWMELPKVVRERDES